MKALITLVSASALSLGLMAAAPMAAADNLVIPLGQQAAQTSTSLPQRGLSTAAVSQRYGEPASRHPAVGQPPITRWDYADFSVYFEYDKVIHSVRQHRRQTP
ncbi:MAG: phosphodiesterase [Pseudomonas sp.]